MTCRHRVYSRYVGSEVVVGIEWLIARCRDCDATMKFPADARTAHRVARMRKAARRGRTAAQIAREHGWLKATVEAILAQGRP